MAHEIEKHDNVVLHKKAAWHGLGVVVEEAPTPSEALKIAGLDWEVEQWPTYATSGELDANGESKRIVLDRVANVRSDTKDVLGVVSKNWTPFQNCEVAEFCEALAEEGDQVKVESAGSIRNGQKMWFLLKGESFSVRGTKDQDVIEPYICVSNGFDGMTGFRATPTTIRVVCSNTLHAVIPRFESESQRLKSLKPAAFVCKHTGNIQERVEEAQRALQLYSKSIEEQHQLIDQVAARDVSREDVQQFFLECYTTDFGAIPTEEGRKRTNALKAVSSMCDRFDREREVCGATAWTAMNAYTGWLQHDRPSKFKDTDRAKETRLQTNLFGSGADRTTQAFKRALQLT